jgi:hypothetical protein
LSRHGTVATLPDAVLYSLLDCSWGFVDGKGQNGRKDILGKILDYAHNNVPEQTLSDRRANKQNQAGNGNLCWNVYNVMHSQYRAAGKK